MCSLLTRNVAWVGEHIKTIGEGEKRLSLFVHIWTSFISGLPVSMTYGGDSLQCSHLCEAYWRRLRALLGFPLNISPKCVNPAHISIESREVNFQRRSCGAAVQGGVEVPFKCTCGMVPPCLAFASDDERQLQEHALRELFAHLFPRPARQTTTTNPTGDSSHSTVAKKRPWFYGDKQKLGRSMPTYPMSSSSSSSSVCAQPLVRLAPPHGVGPVTRRNTQPPDKKRRRSAAESVNITHSM